MTVNRGTVAEQRPDRIKIAERCSYFISLVAMSFTRKPMANAELELDHDGHPDAGLILSQVWGPKTAV